MSATRRKRVSKAVAALATGHSVLAVHLPAVTELRGDVIERCSFNYLLGLADGRADAYWHRSGRISFDRHCFILDLSELCAEGHQQNDYRRGYTRGYNQVMKSHEQQTTTMHEEAAM